MLDGTSESIGENHALWRRLFIALTLSLTAFRLVYIGWLCPFDLAQDEAHYWDWARNLDWSYYSKGPLIAWLIRLSVELFGPLSQALTGSEMPAVRLPAVACGSLLLVALFVLSRQAFHSDRLGFFVALFGSMLPLFSAVSLIMTIDSPFVCCWSWALVAGHRALFRNDRWAWALTGLFLGLGVLAKYTMTLWLFSFCLFLRFSPVYRSVLFSAGFWIMIAVAAACSAPMLGWNANHGWVTLRHVAGQAGIIKDAGIPRSAPFVGKGLFEFLGGQLFLLLVWWFIAWFCAIIRFRPGTETNSSVHYLWWMSLPTLLVFAAGSIRNCGQVNWPVAAYLSGSILMVAWILDARRSSSAWLRRLVRINLPLACVCSLAITVISHDTHMIRTWLFDVAKRFRPNDPFAVRLLDPSCRMRGWAQLGRELDEVRHQVEEEDGEAPMMAGMYWNVPGEIGFYCEGHPKVYSLGPFICERRNQYDLWRPNPVADAHLFAGRTFVIVNGHEPTLRGYFGAVAKVKDVVYREDGIPVASWSIWICRDYFGIDQQNMENRTGY
jgi:4-amino-4-deoxy-L-arabinose transferase-like glycosyltransferase